MDLISVHSICHKNGLDRGISSYECPLAPAHDWNSQTRTQVAAFWSLIHPQPLRQHLHEVVAVVVYAKIHVHHKNVEF
jgi:hypothetical protein